MGGNISVRAVLFLVFSQLTELRKARITLIALILGVHFRLSLPSFFVMSSHVPSQVVTRVEGPVALPAFEALRFSWLVSEHMVLQHLCPRKRLSAIVTYV